MKPARFDYLRPTSLAEALEAKSRHGEAASFLSGGQSLVPAMNFRLAQPQILIDLNHVPELCGIEIAPDRIRIRATTRYRDMERHADLLTCLPILADALPLISHPQIRARSTLGGNMAHADPASEMPAVMIALGAHVVLASMRGERRVAAEDFVTGPLSTLIASDELVTAVDVERWPAGSGMSFQEITRRRGDFAIAGVAAALTMEGAICRRLRIALCGVADRATLAPEAAELQATPLDGAAIARLACTVAEGLQPPGSLQASPDYQRHMAGVLCERALRSARDRALRAEVA